jgi:hypothetical protein
VKHLASPTSQSCRSSIVTPPISDFHSGVSVNDDFVNHQQIFKAAVVSGFHSLNTHRECTSLRYKPGSRFATSWHNSYVLFSRFTYLQPVVIQASTACHAVRIETQRWSLSFFPRISILLQCRASQVDAPLSSVAHGAHENMPVPHGRHLDTTQKARPMPEQTCRQEPCPS